MIGLPDDQNVTKLVKNFHDLEVYKRSFQISLQIHKASLDFPKIEQYALASQIRRASKSLCANIAAGFAEQQLLNSESRRFLLIALGSSHEMLVWIDYCSALEYVSQETADSWKNEYHSITGMLQNFISKV